MRSPLLLLLLWWRLCRLLLLLRLLRCRSLLLLLLLLSRDLLLLRSRWSRSSRCSPRTLRRSSTSFRPLRLSVVVVVSNIFASRLAGLLISIVP